MNQNELSRNEVSAPIMDIKHSTRATKLSTKSSRVATQSNRSSKETSNNVGPPPKPSFLHELISQIPSLGITEFDSRLFLKHFKNHGSYEDCMTKEMIAKFY